MADTKHLYAQIPTALHAQVCEAREQSDLTTAKYVANLLIEYYEMKKNGGNEIMANAKTKTMAFQIPEELFQRIKAHLERESARLGRKVTQREFVLGVIEGALNMAEPMNVDESYVAPCEARWTAATPPAPGGGRTGPVGRGKARVRPPASQRPISR